MNIKSLLLGSAVALVAVSGAQAADAIVVEPEPVEYVRICDMYGSGFFYIPGTETCIKFNGYMRSMYVHNEDNTTANTYEQLWQNRTRIQIDTRNESDWGTIRGWARLQANTTPGANGNFASDKMLISISNDNSTLQVGHLDPFFARNHGFGGSNLWGASGLGEDGFYSYGPGGQNILEYIYSMDGFALTVGIGSDQGYAGASFGNMDAYAGINYSADWGGFAATYVHEGDTTNVLGGDASIWKVSLDLDLSEFIPGGRLYGNYASSDDANTYVSRTAAANTGARDAYIIAYTMDLSDDLWLSAQYSAIDYDAAATQDASQWGVGVGWAPVAGLSFYAGYQSVDYDTGTLIDTDGFTFGVLRSF